MGFRVGTLSSITSSIWLICLLPFDNAHSEHKNIRFFQNQAEPPFNF